MDDDTGVAASRAQRDLNASDVDAAHYARVKEAFLEIVDRPETAQAAALERICGGDPVLRAGVESLLAHHRYESLLLEQRGSSGLEPPSSQRLQAGDAEVIAGQPRGPDETAPQLSRPGSPLGKQIGGIRVERELGTGGMSTVYLGYDERLHRRVAVKSMHSGLRLEKETRTRFLREARVLSQLKHPNICEIYGYEETPDGDFLILEYIDGRSLRRVIEEGLPLRERDRIAATLAEVLQVAHSAGVVHRDLKPENVMLTRDGRVKVLDFGIARIDGDPALLSPPNSPPDPLRSRAIQEAQAGSSILLTRAGHILGTLHYMSPEQARGEPVRPVSDLYALGLLLYELYGGRPAYPRDVPFPSLLERTRQGSTDPVVGLSRNRKRIVQRMLSPTAAARPTATEVVQALQRIRDMPRRWLRRIVVTTLLSVVVLAGVRYVVDVTRAWAQAEAVTGQLEVLGDMLVDDVFNKLSARDRRRFLDRFWHVPLYSLQELPGVVRRESAARLAHRVRNAGRLRLVGGDTAGALKAFERALWLDELTVAPLKDDELREKLMEGLESMRSPEEGCADRALAAAHYRRACAFYAQRLEAGSEEERWQNALASNALALGRTYLETGEIQAARLAFEQAGGLYEQRLEKTSGLRGRRWRFLLAAAHHAVAETQYYGGELDAALEIARESAREYAALVREVSYLPALTASLGQACLTVGRVLQAQGDVAAALETFERARALLKPLNDADPGHQHWLTLLALDHLSIARIHRLRGESGAARLELEQAAAITSGVTPESLLTAQDARAQTLLELGRLEEARPIVDRLIATGWYRDLTRREFRDLCRRNHLLAGATPLPEP